MFKYFVIFVGVIATATAVYAEGEPIRIGLLSNVPPYVQSNPTRGLEPDLIRAVYGYLNKDVKLQHIPILRMDYMLEEGKTDGVAIYRSGKVACFESDIFNLWHDGLLIHPDMKGRVNSLDDLADLSVGSFPNVDIVLPDVAPKLPINSATYVTLHDSRLVYDMFKSGRLDAYIGDYWVLESIHKNQLKKPELKPFHLVKTFTPTERRVCFGKMQNRDEFNKGLRAIKRSKEYDAIQLKYKPE
ncbi:ABC transporter substrate-binding protein [Kordiimonas sp. SCSIO 12603]|uniref:substrate-binding periplasmic protein n=1 Tax=Kordiimonas sp. SCSIO 12603 TaxID=2829596 RepID=UPI00210407C2|nr:ABC transporter substrate-binding protein [Kordiimonas sp. SCSIO 12603]UTW57013.1 ABC transporter substrate-binding protein [Kordiimonas sp. SCSIO 12603]